MAPPRIPAAGCVLIAVTGPRVYVDAAMASVHLVMAYGARVTPQQIRQWGTRGLVSRRPCGRFRYDLEEVEAYAMERGLLNCPGTTHRHEIG